MILYSETVVIEKVATYERCFLATNQLSSETSNINVIRVFLIVTAVFIPITHTFHFKFDFSYPFANSKGRKNRLSSQEKAPS